ncbi:MAG: hypothetical protein A2W90_16460 [Bacteroidetes bacterium GWF2_42_66]|nr:MAG: hypothetical protein A2W92_04155 [Bacteroidetes bacterium GWA2_42_15]OFX96287.1 MAG: hypothetical protein A2W89_05390 [Bacteroidetes bacterium GWE2_42_39]OFY46326.1 MAG: hypothetical protein A2W90_16460 [Bacteroidetes bacterium GWF2_42_66]HAZ03443.1 hypothetical protein [Marinilabiliales bacterium]HBL78291.1 hypothetical protein [Prolixibacteraceae bacterium]
MDKLFINLTDRDSIIPSEEVEGAMLRHFSNAVNIEWFYENGVYETIFYLDNKEYIAKFDRNARLIDYRVNLPLDLLPVTIEKSIDPEKEIMNLVEIHKNNAISYELILRNKELIRFVALFSQTGEKLSMKEL